MGERNTKTGVYLVERYVAGSEPEELRRISERLRTAVHELNRDAVTVQYLESILISGEESCFCLFRAESQDAVREVNERAQLPYLRIVGVITVSGEERRARPSI